LFVLLALLAAPVQATDTAKLDNTIARNNIGSRLDGVPTDSVRAVINNSSPRHGVQPWGNVSCFGILVSNPGSVLTVLATTGAIMSIGA